MRRELVDIKDVLTNLPKLLGRLIGEDVVLETSLAPELGSVITDRSQLEQVVMNLVVNARDAMPRGGAMSLSTAEVVVPAGDSEEPGRENAAERFESEVPWVSPFESPHGTIQHIGTVPPGRYGQFTIRDSGTGMEADTLARILEPFFTTKVGGKGTGLGLPIVYGVVQQSDGYLVISASGGKEALALLETHAGAIDLVITDVVMPGMSGSELVAILKERYPTVEVVYTSGYTDDMVVRHGVSSDKVRFLSKPYSAAVLTEMVRSVREP